MTSIRVLIVDDHPLAREGLKAVLSKSGFTVAGEASSGEEALAMISDLRPDVILMDVRLGPGMDGLEACRRIAALGVDAKVLMLTLHDMPAYVREALAAGASGYVLKDTAIDDLKAAIVRVAEGHTAIPLDLVTAALRQPAMQDRQLDLIATLTARERQILHCVAEGMTNKEVGRHLDISPATVKAHVERIIAKLGVTDRTQAAVAAARHIALLGQSS
ncbi:response regulator [Asticcacaulis biprosthecium]